MSNLEIILIAYAIVITIRYWKDSHTWWKAGITYGVKHYKVLSKAQLNKKRGK